VAILDDLNQFQLWERDVVRKLDRFTALPAKEALLSSIEQKNRSQASAEQKHAVALLADIQKKLAGPIAAKIGGTGIVALASLNLESTSGEIDAAKKDAALRSSLQGTAESAAQTFRNLKDLLGEREKPAAAANKPATQPAALTLEQWEKLRSPEALRAQLMSDKRLPPAVRDIMLKSLSKEFPGKYRDLLGAYYASFATGEKKE